ncbi:MAG: efflux RND transporter periplasmic adaptor subunit [Candidatus Cloacimonetes bacterium]|nr:efflux RND transporter periplasmic adaptor subunit [Candidatus Cloacimonadota bacterium]
MKKISYILLIMLGILAGCQRAEKEPGWTSVMEAEINRVSVVGGGKIVELMVNEGDEVAVGEILALLDSRELSYNLEQINASLAEIQAQEALANTQISIAEKELEYQSRRDSRNEKLYEAAAIPLQNLEDSQLVQNKSALQLQTAQQNLGVLEAKKAALEAQKKVLNKKLADCIVTSPFAGRVERLFYNAGETVAPFGQILEISNLQNMETNIYVSEEWLAKLKPGTQMKLKTSGGGQELAAEIIRISNQAEFTPKSVLTPDNRSVMVYAVRLRVENPDGILKDGMPVDIYLP